MFPCSAVNGVRNSWEASATKRCWASRDRSRLPSIALRVVASRPTSSSTVVSGKRRPGSAVRSISAADEASRFSGRKRAAQQERDGSGAERGCPQRGQDDSCSQCTEGVLEIAGRGRDDHGPTGGRPTELRERRDVQTDPVTRLGRVTECRHSRGDHALRQCGRRKHPTAQTERAGDEPTATVEHLHARVRATQGRLERTGRRQQRGRRRAQLRDRNGATPQGAVQGVTEVTLYHEIDGHSERDDREQDRQRGRDHRATADRQPGHAPSLNPTPRTVSISGGSPSFRRRYET